MSDDLADDVVAKAYIEACLAELDALKPGNVHRYAGDPRHFVEDFEKSAEASAPYLANSELKVGERIRGAAEATAEACGTNTNLGIILLSAPLAAAAQRSAKKDLQHRLARTLMKLDKHDAREAYAGIRAANAGGLGEVPEHDVADQPSTTFLEAMSAAQSRDRIAWNYTHDFADIFEIGLPTLAQAMERWGASNWALAAVYMTFLAAEPDSLIARKHGMEAASGVREEAGEFAEKISASDDPEKLESDLLCFDRSLKKRALNPGTTADLTVATLFADRLQRLESAQ
ncbi:ATP:dephospho-CoA triphosphoribosyl transferase [Methyloligella halotolerans]|uniref:ATP:dephospho-CoA triphosphoribosyl transferase n=1 Tax=Methyloligella halotolerans TaxID=1177755 RepID=A0A1E2S2P8_9HYPH|nr:triphosphoribosyl-dephospho-CoA synthase [Methyloligella halotolerans]ODA68793.1 ATP:dephospho-CoA triphosphoribosyl transferase [Methyloligella halotolerans]